MTNDIISQLKTIRLNVFDKIFLFVYAIIVAYMIYNGVTVLTIGGFVLICGAFLTYKGQIFLATASYIFADLCWIFNAWYGHDIQGVIFIAAGILFGILATYKMKNGHMKKDLLNNKCE